MEGKPTQLLVDTGAQHLVLLQDDGPVSSKNSWVQGATHQNVFIVTQRTVDIGMGWVSHSFMVIPDCPYPLLGQDLLSKMGAQIHFLPGRPQLTGLKLGEPMGGGKPLWLPPAGGRGYLVYRQEQFSPWRSEMSGCCCGGWQNKCHLGRTSTPWHISIESGANCSHQGLETWGCQEN